MRWPRRTSKSRSAAVVSGPGAAPATAASYSSTSSARPRGGESFEAEGGVKLGESGCVDRKRSITVARRSFRGERLLHRFRELVVGRRREFVERKHPVCDAPRRVDDEEVAVVEAAARR